MLKMGDFQQFWKILTLHSLNTASFPFSLILLFGMPVRHMVDFLILFSVSLSLYSMLFTSLSLCAELWIMSSDVSSIWFILYLKCSLIHTLNPYTSLLFVLVRYFSSVYLFGCIRSSLWHMGFPLVVVHRFSSCGSWALVVLKHVASSFPDQGSNSCPLHWKAGS